MKTTWARPPRRSRSSKLVMTVRRVTEDHAVRPVELVLVELDRLVCIQLVDVEEGLLEALAADGAHDLLGRELLVDVDRRGWDVDVRALHLACPDHLGIEVGVVGQVRTGLVRSRWARPAGGLLTLVESGCS